MWKAIATVIVVFVFAPLYGQEDTLVFKKQKGFLFLSAYNYQYDWNGGHFRPIGFHDFFYPTLDFQNDFMSKDTILFTRGIRIDFIGGRFGLKKNATLVYGKDVSGCYQYDSFYVVPVILDLKQFEDNHPSICERNFYEFQTLAGKKLKFEYLHKAAFITRLSEIPEKKGKGK